MSKQQATENDAISLEPATSRVEALFEQLLAEMQQTTREYGIDRALQTARTGGRR